MSKTLNRVTDKFSLFNDGRKLLANKRKYIIESVDAMFNSDLTKEKLRLGEALGYYGHGKRQMANKLDLQETEIVNVNGKPVIIENVPACRTIDISVNSDGVVTHTQEILATKSGEVVNSLLNSGVGGWSWATGGKNLANGESYTSTFSGFDYVLQPNYLSLNHPTMMLESVDGKSQEVLIMESLIGIGFDNESAQRTLAKWRDDNLSDLMLVDLEQQNLILEGIIREKSQKISELEQHQNNKLRRNEMLLEAVSALPIYISDEQKESLLRLESDHDASVLRSLFESLAAQKLRTLPLSGNKADQISSTAVYGNQLDQDQLFDFCGTNGTLFN